MAILDAERVVTQAVRELTTAKPRNALRIGCVLKKGYGSGDEAEPRHCTDARVKGEG